MNNTGSDNQRMFKILIANPGSTSYKCKLFNTENMEVLFSASVEKIGSNKSIFTYQINNLDSCTKVLSIPDHYSAIDLTINKLSETFSLEGLSAIGFKTVHAKGITGCVQLDEKVIDAMQEYHFLAPVHTEIYLTAISIFKKLLPDKLLIGLFETHYHKKIPASAYLYGIPYKYYEEYGIRKYGFHGASHSYISLRAKELYGANKIISCHLGGSSSVCAIKDGWSIDTSMGMSPQSGLLNAKRVGDLDPFALLYLMEKEQLSPSEMGDILNNKSGLYGISGIKSGDFRDIREKMDQGNSRAIHAFNAYVYSVRRYIGEYLVTLNGADCIVFTAGAGENDIMLRQAILNDMENLGIILDLEKNDNNPKEGLISTTESKIQIAVIPTNEELIVAKNVLKYLEQ